jgi:ubiquinone/menaquinone biosynthesis C-methylase UbiE
MQNRSTLTTQDWHQRFSQQALWTESIREHLYQKFSAELNLSTNKWSDRYILDIGCGTGAISRSLMQISGIANPPPAEILNPINIHGLDILHERLQHAVSNDPDTDYSCGDALFLPYKEDIFDISLCHYLLLWLLDPAAGLNEMLRVTHAGGIVAALAEPDYGGRIDFPPQLEELGKLQREALERQGADTRMGRKLRNLFTNAGLKNVQSGLLGGQWRGMPSVDEWESEWQMLETDLKGMISPDQMDALRREEADAWKNGERILFVPTFYAWGVVED